MNLLAPFQSGDIILISIFSIMILTSIQNWYIAFLKFISLKKALKLETKITLKYSNDILGLELAYRDIDTILEQKQNNLEKSLSFLATSASVTPFIGLLGTVWGIAKALNEIGLNGNASLSVIAGPIGEALISTAVGLFVAIPASIFYNMLLSKVEDIMAQSKSQLENKVCQYFKDFKNEK